MLRQILDRPEDLAARTVYADELQARGDPRGEMIALELAGARAQAAELRGCTAGVNHDGPGDTAYTCAGGQVDVAK